MATATTAPRALERRISPLLFTGFVVASIGGPLALGALYAPGAAEDVLPSAGFAIALAILLFAAPVAIWAGYSERIASAGGLTAFVEAAVGRRAARLQALVWGVSYSLYLPYTVTYVVYDLLPQVVPGERPYRVALELVLPVTISALVLAPVAWVLRLLLAVAGVQLVLMLVLAGVELAHAGSPASSFVPHEAAGTTVKGAAGIGVLFVCASLPLFAGAEVRGGTRTIRRGLVAGFALVSAYLLAMAYPLAAVPDSLRSAELPGVAIAQAYSGHTLATTVGLAAAASVTALIVAEYLAIGRLAHYVLGAPVRGVLAAVAVPFVAADAISLVDPNRFYDDLLKPSLVALFIAQIAVFAVYPVYRRRLHGRVRPRELALVAVAVALMGYGLYNVFGSAAT